MLSMSWVCALLIFVFSQSIPSFLSLLPPFYYLIYWYKSTNTDATPVERASGAFNPDPLDTSPPLLSVTLKPAHFSHTLVKSSTGFELPRSSELESTPIALRVIPAHLPTTYPISGASNGCDNASNRIIPVHLPHQHQRIVVDGCRLVRIALAESQPLPRW